MTNLATTRGFGMQKLNLVELEDLKTECSRRKIDTVYYHYIVGERGGILFQADNGKGLILQTLLPIDLTNVKLEDLEGLFKKEFKTAQEKLKGFSLMDGWFNNE